MSFTSPNQQCQSTEYLCEMLNPSLITKHSLDTVYKQAKLGDWSRRRKKPSKRLRFTDKTVRNSTENMRPRLLPRIAHQLPL